MKTTNKLNYKVTSEEAFVCRFYFNINFIVNDKEYLASCTYFNGDIPTDYLVEDENGNEVEDEAIIELGHYLIDNMEITTENLAW